MVHTFNSVEEATEVAKKLGIDIDYVQIRPGPYLHGMNLTQHDHLVFGQELFTSDIAASGETAVDGFLVILPDQELDKGSDVLVNGARLEPDELLISCPGGEVNGCTKGRVCVRQINVPREYVANAVNILGSDEFRLAASSLLRLRLNVEDIRKLSSSLDMAISNQEPCEDLVRETDSRLMRHFTGMNETLQPGPQRHKGRPPADHNRIYRRAVDYIHCHLKSPISMQQLCLATGASLKTLERVFMKHASISPRLYIQICKLHATRRELLRASAAETTVSTIASEYEFNHLGRFSSTYYGLFGEYPKQTLSR